MNALAPLRFMSMDLKKFIIIIATIVLVVTILNTSALKVSSNLPKAILFILKCMVTFTMRVHIVIEHISKVTLFNFCKLLLIHNWKIKSIFTSLLIRDERTRKLFKNMFTNLFFYRTEQEHKKFWHWEQEQNENRTRTRILLIFAHKNRTWQKSILNTEHENRTRTDKYACSFIPVYMRKFLFFNFRFLMVTK